MFVVFIGIQLIESEKKMHETRRSQHETNATQILRGGEMEIMSKLFLHRFMLIVIQIMRIQRTNERTKKNRLKMCSFIGLVVVCTFVRM